MASTKSSNSDWVQPYEKANEILKELNDLRNAEIIFFNNLIYKSKFMKKKKKSV